MLFDVFEHSLERAVPPPFYSEELKALWWAAKDQPNEAMRLVRVVDNANRAWVRAHLARMKGDLGCARRWYARARKRMPDTPIERERLEIALALLADLDARGRVFT
jgi:hypothetical protein